jgi:hypothetical protein
VITMRGYIIVSGLLFGLITAAHAARLVAEGLGPLGEPLFLASTLVSAAMSGWAWFAQRSSSGAPASISAN